MKLSAVDGPNNFVRLRRALAALGEFVGVLENGIDAGAKLTELTDEVDAASEVDDVDVAATGAGGGVESSDMRMSSLKSENASPNAGRSAGA